MHRADGRSFWQHSPAIYVLHRIILTNVESQISHKFPDLGYPFSTTNGILYCEEGQPLLLEYFITFIRCIRQNGEASVRIHQHLCVALYHFDWCWVSNFTLISRFGVPSQHNKWEPSDKRVVRLCKQCWVEPSKIASGIQAEIETALPQLYV